MALSLISKNENVFCKKCKNGHFVSAFFFFFDIKSCDHSANVYSQHYGVIAKYPN